MAWDESLFRHALRSAERLFARKSAAPEDLASVGLAGLSSRLQLLACALTGESIQVREAEDLGGYSGNRFYLPGRMDLYRDPSLNAQAYVYRIAYTHASRSLGHTLAAGNLSTEERLRLSSQAIPATLAFLETELPSAARLKEELLSALPAERLSTPGSFKLWGLLMPPAPPEGAADAGGNEFPAQSLSSGTEKMAKPRESAERIALSKDREAENPLVHILEKVQTAEEYRGGNKATDGKDELEEQTEALEELDLKYVIRSKDRAHSVYKSNAILDGGAPDLLDHEGKVASPGTVFTYDEWDERSRTYRKDWCTVIDSRAIEASTPADPPKRKREVNELKARLARLLTERAWRSRQLDGPEIDLDAVVDRIASLRSGHAAPDRLYSLRRKNRRELATLILLDGSLSTDSWIGGHRVMDIARESILVLGEVLDGMHDSVTIGAFHSNTRRDCRFLRIKDFDDDWKSAQRRLASIEPQGYTRIGPALRHATRILSETAARRKLLILISDGKPSDYDRYEGSYGIADVRQAIREATQSAIRLRALAIDSEAKFHLPRMFGAGNYQILPHPGLLAGSLARIYSEVLR